MSLPKAIRFQHLARLLTDQERSRFVSELAHSHIDTILSALFQHFRKPNHITQVNEINSRLSDIIQSREEEPQPLCTRNIKIDQIPRALIGYMASFLDQLGYVRFSMSNRSIYLGCNSPNVLHTLCLSSLKRYSSIKLAAFPSLSKLRIDPRKAIKSRRQMSFDSPNFSHVTELALQAHKKRDWVEPFFNQNIVNCDHVTTLDCEDFGSNDHEMRGSEFLSLLTKFPNVTQLQLHSVKVTDDVTAHDIADLCPKIAALSVRFMSPNVCGDLVRIVGSQLQSLACMPARGTEYDFGNVDFDKLEELGLFAPDNRCFDGILKSSVNLKRIVLFPMQDLMSDDEIKNGIEKLMIKCASINCMYFPIRFPSSHFRPILEGIECGLLKTKTRQRKQLKIHMKCGDFTFEANSFMLYVGRIVNSLHASSTTDFMLIWKFKDVTEDVLNEIFNNLCNLSRYIKVTRFQKNKFVVANDNCKINGCIDSVFGWNMDLL
eukprot:1058720_1